MHKLNIEIIIVRVSNTPYILSCSAFFVWFNFNNYLHKSKYDISTLVIRHFPKKVSNV